MHPEIAKEWHRHGGEHGFLGRGGDGGHCRRGHGRYHHFERGSIHWSPGTGAHETHGGIRRRWESLGWETSFLGYPKTCERVCRDGRGRYQHFEGGSIHWHERIGAHETHGAIREHWAWRGWETGPLGYPVSDEEDLTTADLGRLIERYPHLVFIAVAVLAAFGVPVPPVPRLVILALRYLPIPTFLGRISRFEHGSVIWIQPLNRCFDTA
jgi:uncharacterized protein with LGFP repeats